MFLVSIVVMVVKISLLEYTHRKRILIFILASKEIGRDGENLPFSVGCHKFFTNPKSHALSYIYFGILFCCTKNQKDKILGKILGMHQKF